MTRVLLDPPRPVGVERRRPLAGPGRPAPHRPRPRTRPPTPPARLGVVDAIVASDLQRATETAHHHLQRARGGPAGAGSRASRTRRRRVVGPHPARDRARTGPATSTRSRSTGRVAPATGPRRMPRRSPRRSGAARRAGSLTTVLLARVLAAFGRIHDLAPDGEAIAVTHGGVIYVARGPVGRRRSSGWPTWAAAGSRWVPGVR